MIGQYTVVERPCRGVKDNVVKMKAMPDTYKH
jgi:hypothetical protein